MPMIFRMNRAPILAFLLSLLWLGGTAISSLHLLIPVAVAVLLAPAGWALARRDPRDGRLLGAGLAAAGAAMGALLLFLHLFAWLGPWVFLAEIAAMATGAVAIPLLYAGTFSARDGDAP